MRMSISRGMLALAGAATVAATVVALGQAGPEPATARTATTQGPRERVVAPGRVEAISEEIEIGVEIAGRIVALHAQEGDSVRAGQLLAELENRDYRAQVAVAEARVAEARAVLARTRNGSRREERREAGAAVDQAEAVVEQARREAARREVLAADGVIAREERDRASRDVAVADARLRALRERLALVEAGPRVEDHRQAEAALAAAIATLHEARARLAKTAIASPIDGTVLRRRLRVGESVTPEVPGTSLYTVADLSRLRVRIDVDEHDIGAVALGQRAYVTAAAYGDRRFEGRVIRVSRILGRKNIRTDEPRERVDMKILEVLVELDEGASLPIGLRVDATLLTDSTARLRTPPRG
jgi:HlyD family secretion protein